MARIVLVHGAFAGAWCWEPVLPGLRAAGHAVVAIDLPGSGDDATPVAEVTFDAYAERVCRTLREGEPAMLVGHSMGGMVITQAAAWCPEQITALVYVAAFLPGDGQSLLNLTAYPEAADDQVQANAVVEGDPPVATMPAAASRTALFGCCNEEQAAWGIGHLGPQPAAPFGHPVQLSVDDTFTSLPRGYVTCAQDRAIPPQMQRLMFETAGCDPVIEIDTDHSPWISRTAELVAALDGLASREGFNVAG
jgi:pimeloyl-ACP methyl ester carboxylesterase